MYIRVLKYPVRKQCSALWTNFSTLLLKFVVTQNISAQIEYEFIHCIFWNIAGSIICWFTFSYISPTLYIHSWQKRLLHDDVSFLWLFLFHQSARSKDRLFGVIYCFLCIWCSVVFCQFWRHLMIKWVIGRMCIPKCHWMIIVVNLVEQRWFFSWRCLVVSFCVCQVNIGYSRLSRR